MEHVTNSPSVREGLRVARRFHLALPAILTHVARFGKYIVPLRGLGAWIELGRNGPHAVQRLRENGRPGRFREFALGGFH